MNQEKAVKIIKKLKEMYPDATCSLDFSTPFQMLVAVCLSAQCTDERVNKTTPEIFEKYPTVYDFYNMHIKVLEELIHPCGFYKNKAKNLKAASKMIIEKFNGGPVGIDALAASIGEEAGTIEDVYEPYLLQNGFLKRTSRGRVVTEKAYKHLRKE